MNRDPPFIAKTGSNIVFFVSQLQNSHHYYLRPNLANGMVVLYFQGWAGGWVAGGIKSKTSLGPIVTVKLYYGPRLAIS